MSTNLRCTPPDTAFVWSAPVYFDDLDAMGMLHNAHYAVLVDRVISAYFESCGLSWEPQAALNPDQHWAVRHQSLEYLTPVRGVGAVEIALWLSAIGRTSATYSAEFRSQDVVHARTQRTVVKLDIDTGLPSPWSPRTRGQLTAIAESREGALA